MKQFFPLQYSLLLTLVGVSIVDASEGRIGRLLETIRQVQTDGQGNPEAAEAWRELIQEDAEQLPTILKAFEGAGPLAANWLRAAVDTIAMRQLSSDGKLPAGEIESFIRDSRHDPQARRLAYQWLARVDTAAPDRLMPTMLHDPSVEMRREAVARRLGEADALLEQKRSDEAAKAYREALTGARDEDQVRRIVKQLESLGQKVDLHKHFGFLTDWKMIGPFDNTGRKGFETAYPPEQVIDLSATYEGKIGPVSWIDYETDHEYGMVNLNDPYGQLKQVVGYAWTEFHSSKRQPIQLRLACKNAWKVWLNGELLFARDEYHRLMQLDQYRMKATLEPGANQILVKVCQNEEVESWTVEWQFQLRVCDSTGTAILSEKQ